MKMFGINFTVHCFTAVVWFSNWLKLFVTLCNPITVFYSKQAYVIAIKMSKTSRNDF